MQHGLSYDEVGCEYYIRYWLISKSGSCVRLTFRFLIASQQLVSSHLIEFSRLYPLYTIHYTLLSVKFYYCNDIL